LAVSSHVFGFVCAQGGGAKVEAQRCELSLLAAYAKNSKLRLTMRRNEALVEGVKQVWHHLLIHVHVHIHVRKSVYIRSVSTTAVRSR
jgi:hypothetical protein